MRRGRLLSDAALAGVSMVATGLTNLALPLAVQASSGLISLGYFAVAFTPPAVALAVSRTLAGQTLLRGHPIDRVPGLRRTLALLVCGSSVATALLVTALPVSAVYYALVPVAALVPIQDILRQVFFGVRLPGISALADVVWLAVFLGGSLVLLRADQSGLGLVIGMYGLGAAISIGLLLMLLSRRQVAEGELVPAPIGSITLESVTIYGFGQLSTLGATALGLVGAVGTFRSALLALAGVSMLVSLSHALLIPRLRTVGPGWAAWILLVLLGSATALTLAAFAVLPAEQLSRLGFDVSGPFLWSVAVGGMGFMLGGALSVQIIGIRDNEPRRRWLSSRLGSAVAEPVITLPLAVLIGAPGLSSNMVTNSLAFWTIRALIPVTKEETYART